MDTARCRAKHRKEKLPPKVALPCLLRGKSACIEVSAPTLSSEKGASELGTSSGGARPLPPLAG